MNQEKIDYDVVIVGAGMVGATLAVGLATTLPALKVALLDAQQPKLEWDSQGYDMRVSAITRASQHIFENIGAWQGICAQRVSPYRDMHVWDAAGNGEIHFDSADLGEADLGHIVENRVIIKSLHERIAQLKNINLLCPAQIASMQINPQSVAIELKEGTGITAKLLVGADGSNSWVRKQAGIAVKGWDFDQAALVTTVKTERYHVDTAWQRFLPTGPLAFLPLTEGYSSIVWSTSPGEAKRLSVIDENEFAHELEAAFESKLGTINSVAARAVFPLRLFETQHYVQPRLALVGDAAHTIHPLAGQGVNLGLADVASLIDVLEEAFVNKNDLGDYSVLRNYERWRRADNRSMLVAMDGLKRMFGSELPVIKEIRNFGLSLTNRITPLKNLIMEQAMGITGEQPRLSR